MGLGHALAALRARAGRIRLQRRGAGSKLLSETRSYQPDLIYERYAFGNAAGVLTSKKLGVPLVLEVNSPMVLELSKTRGLSFPKLARDLENYIFRGADRVCVVTEVLRGMLLEAGVAPERVFVTPNGVHPELYRHGDGARQEARAALGLGPQDDGEVLGFVGYYRNWHRLDRAVRALVEPELTSARSSWSARARRTKSSSRPPALWA